MHSVARHCTTARMRTWLGQARPAEARHHSHHAYQVNIVNIDSATIVQRATYSDAEHEQYRQMRVATGQQEATARGVAIGRWRAHRSVKVRRLEARVDLIRVARLESSIEVIVLLCYRTLPTTDQYCERSDAIILHSKLLR